MSANTKPSICRHHLDKPVHTVGTTSGSNADTGAFLQDGWMSLSDWTCIQDQSYHSKNNTSLQWVSMVRVMMCPRAKHSLWVHDKQHATNRLGVIHNSNSFFLFSFFASLFMCSAKGTSKGWMRFMSGDDVLWSIIEMHNTVQRKPSKAMWWKTVNRNGPDNVHLLERATLYTHLLSHPITEPIQNTNQRPTCSNRRVDHHPISLI